MRLHSSVREIPRLRLSESSDSYNNLSLVGTCLVIDFYCTIGIDVYFMIVYFIYHPLLGLFMSTVKQTTQMYTADYES